MALPSFFVSLTSRYESSILGLGQQFHLPFRLGMPTILRRGPYRFFFVSIDHNEPSHIHVRREKMVAKFWLDPVALQNAGGFNRAELNKIARLINENRERLLER